MENKPEIQENDIDISPPIEAPTYTETIQKTESAQVEQPTERKEKIQEVLEEIKSFSQENTTTKKPDHPELDSQFFSVDDYFKKGNTHKTGYSILGYEAMEPITFWKTVIKSAKKYIPEGNRTNMADIGCAYGYLLKHISPEFSNTYGVDISRTALEKAKVASPASQLIETNLNQEGLPFADDSLDMITLLDSIEHVETPEKLLQQAYEKLKSGGIAVISSPDIGNWLGKIIANANGDPSHISLFTQKDLIQKLENIGFEILEKRPFFPLGPIRIPIPANVEIVVRKNASKTA